MLHLLHSLIEKGWQPGRVDGEWKVAEGVYIPKERDSHSLSQFRLISLLNVEGKVFFPSLRRELRVCTLCGLTWRMHTDWCHTNSWKTFETYRVPRHVVQIIQMYFDGFMMRFSTKTYTTKWVVICDGVRDIPLPFRTSDATSTQRSWV